MDDMQVMGSADVLLPPEYDESVEREAVYATLNSLFVGGIWLEGYDLAVLDEYSREYGFHEDERQHVLENYLYSTI